METLACGEIGLSIDYFYSLTPREFNNIVRGYSKKEERQMQLSWQQTRNIMFSITMPNLPKSKRNLKITEFMPFPWEETLKENKPQTKAELKALFAKWDKAIPKQ